MSKKVYVELGDHNLPIRIYRNKDWAFHPDLSRVQLMDRGVAVSLIRKQVFERAKGLCEDCGKNLTWVAGEMNEIRPKGAGGGKTGGEVSLDNCEWLCHSCHQSGPNARHADRRWQTARLRGANGTI